MKISVLLGLALGLTLVFSSCSQPTSSTSSTTTSVTPTPTPTPTPTTTVYKNQVLPNTSTVKLPTSLTSSSTAASLAGARTTTVAAQSEGYQQIKNMTGLMSTIQPVLLMFESVVDAAISQNNLKPGTDTKNVVVTPTQAMINALAEQLPASDSTSNEAGMVGQPITINDFNYLATNSAASLPNSAVITVTQPATSTAAASSMSMTFSWSTQAIKMSMTMSGTTLELVADGADNSTSFKVSMPDQTVTGNTDSMQMSVVPDPKSTLNGVFASMSFNIAGTDTATYGIYGYADNNGGVTNTSITMTPSGGTATNYYWQEGFDGTGNVVFQDTYTDTAFSQGQTVVFDNGNGATWVKTYGTDLTTANGNSYQSANLL
ncbi:MAG: hypothetical protein HKM05_06505 [Spirochaetales bacterium]|nr:hypothetical protein [Spirochaetales bacterium]